jgi:hypothetical protein
MAAGGHNIATRAENAWVSFRPRPRVLRGRDFPNADRLLPWRAAKRQIVRAVRKYNTAYHVRAESLLNPSSRG